MKFRLISLYILGLCSTSAYSQDNPWSVSFQTGYSALSDVEAVSVRNSIPVSLSLRYQLDPNWIAKMEYQWIKTEHTGSQSAHFQTLRSSAGYALGNFETHYFGLDAGLGYHFANLSGVDQIRQVEFSTGPTWSWSLFQQWNIEGNIKYARAMDGWMSTSSQRFEFSVGMAFQFGERPLFYSKSQGRAFMDADQDGVPDTSDQCSATPFGMKVAKNGCALDGDGDLVVDYNDYCPNTKRGTEVDEMGCPINSLGRGVIDGIAFEYNSPRLTAASKVELEKVALTLKSFPDIYFLIEGYSSTATSSSEKMNISKARAITVMNILASYGVPTSKMKAIGLSDQYPLTESTHKADQILNERIEIKWKHQL